MPAAAAAAAVVSTSALQLAANRANALRATGPNTAEGKLASSRNALSHGLTTADPLLPFEDPAEYSLHHQAWTEYYRPRNPVARALVIELADLEWRLRRVPAFEANLLAVECRKLTSGDPDLKPLVKNLQSESEVLAVAFTRLVENKVLPNLLNQEARIARRADKIRRRLESIALEPPRNATMSASQPQSQPQLPPEPEPQPPVTSEIETEEIENWKNEPNPPTQQPIRAPHKIGRNEPCPCRSGLKFKRCCLNKPVTTTTTSGSVPESA